MARKSKAKCQLDEVITDITSVLNKAKHIVILYTFILLSNRNFTGPVHLTILPYPKSASTFKGATILYF